jgi:tetratricopeptide (TPR) repeat protein
MPEHMREDIAAWLYTLGVADADRNARLLAATVGEMGAEGVDKDLLFAAWRSTLEAVSRRAPLVIVFEDLHWSSDSLLDLAEFVMQPRGEAAVLMIVLARPELLDRRPNWGGGRLNHLAIALEPLGESAIATLVTYLLETDAPEVIDLVAERSEGNPFYAGELVRSYLEQGSLARLPDTVQATVLARLDLLPPMERRVLQLGSVFGRSFRAAGVQALEAGLAGQALHLCENLADRDLIRPSDGDRYSFRHILIQEVAYGTLPRSERARLHAEAAHWVESTSAGRDVALAEILAFHYREAAVLLTALDPSAEDTKHARGMAAKWLLKAADVASSAGATPEAARHIRASFDFVDRSVLPHLHERLGDLTAGDTGLEEYSLALESYEQLDAPADDRLRALGGMLMVATRWQGSVGDRPSKEWMNELRAKGWRLLEKATDRRSIGRFLAADAFYPFWVQVDGIPDDAVVAEGQASAEKAIVIADELDDRELASAALDALGGIATSRNNWAAAIETARERLKFEDRLGLYERLDAHSMVAWMSYLAGDLATADRDSAQMVARLLPGQAPYPALHLFAWRALTLSTLGRWDEATTVFYRALEAWHDAGSHAAGYGLRGFIAGLNVGVGRGDGRLVAAATDAIESILSRFPADHLNQLLRPFIKGDAGFADSDPVTVDRQPSEMVERRLCLANDNHQAVPEAVLETILARAISSALPLLEAQARRTMGLARRDLGELDRAIEMWERIGSTPNLGRARAERGAVRGDAAETEAGIAILKKVGDTNYIDRFQI